MTKTKQKTNIFFNVYASEPHFGHTLNSQRLTLTPFRFQVWPEPTQEEAVTFLNNYYHHHHMAGLVQHTAMDFFYIPQLLVERFASFSRFFLKHGVLVELAVPTLMYGVARGPHLKVVPCSILWYGKHRANPHTFFNYTHTFIHPFKFKANLELKDPTDFFCRVYMETLMSELEKNSGR